MRSGNWRTEQFRSAIANGEEFNGNICLICHVVKGPVIAACDTANGGSLTNVRQR